MKRTIGLILSDKKWIELGLPLMTTLESMTDRVQVKRIQVQDAHRLSLLGPFDVIVQKINDVLYTAKQEKESLSATFLVQLQSYSEQCRMQGHPVVFVDPISGTLEKLMDRLSMTQLLDSFLKEHAILTSLESRSCLLPESILAQNWSCLLPSQNMSNTLCFPLILKSGLACSGPESHHMWIVQNKLALNLLYQRQTEIEAEAETEAKTSHSFKLSFPLLVQEYIPHAQLLFKVYVMGKDHFVTQRASVDLSHLNPDDQGIYFFNSQKMDKVHSKNQVKQNEPNLSCSTLDPMVDLDFVAEIVQKLRAFLNLNLFGFDIVVHEQTRVHYIVDLNYFPGYHGIPERLTRLSRFILSQLNPPIMISDDDMAQIHFE